MWAMVVKEFRELRRDRRTMAMLIVFPILLLVLFGYAANFDVTSIRAVVTGPQADVLAPAVVAPFDVTAVEPSWSAHDAQDDIRDGHVDVAFVTVAPTDQAGSGGSATTTVYVNGASLFTAQSAVAAVTKANLAGAQLPTGPMTIDVLYNPDLKTSWVMVPALIGLILTFIGTIITSLGLVRERQDGTLEQLAVMPLRPWDVIAGKIAPYFLVAALDMIVVTVLGIVVFGVPFNGSVLLFAVGAAIFLLVVLGTGVMISTFSQTQGQAIQTAMFVLLPQVLLSGMIFPLSAMPWSIRWIGYLLPLTYFIEIAQGVMLKGAPLSALWPALVVLTGMAAVIFTTAILRFRRDLAPSSNEAS
jgi:ABC-2 type transport system permease protein